MYERASEPFLHALSTCADHLSIDELIEVCRTGGGESEMSDLLRHAANRLVRPHGWIVEREISDRGHGISRVDLALSDTGGPRFGWIEAKMRYATDAVQAPDYILDDKNGLLRDVEKLRRATTAMPRFLLHWTPYLAHSVYKVRYANGHRFSDDGWRIGIPLEDCRAGWQSLLDKIGPTQRVEVKSGVGKYGEITLDAWWTWIHPDPDGTAF